MSQWQTAGKKLYAVEELREILAVPKSYLYADFKRKILKKAEAELKKDSDIFFEYKEETKNGGRKVTHILFDIIKSGGTDKQKPSIEEYKRKIIYTNGADKTILNVWESENEKGYVIVQLMDEFQTTTTEKFNLSQLKKMIEYVENRA